MSYLQLHRLLRWPSGMYSVITRSRNYLYDKSMLKSEKTGLPVISIGNLSSGGTGKTPLTIQLASGLQAQGWAPVVLSRGYGGIKGGKPEQVTDHFNHEFYGDEPVLIARTIPDIPVVISRDRVAGVLWIQKHLKANCVILDDGFQHRRLVRDIDIVILDSRYPVTRELHLPFGKLRENISSLKRADIIVFSHTDAASSDSSDIKYLESINPSTPIFYSRHVPLGIRDVRSGKMYNEIDVKQPAGLISAIGSPAGFKSVALKLGVKIVYEKHFRDHHVLNEDRWLAEIEKAKDNGCDIVIITAKDESRYPACIEPVLPVRVLDIEIEIEKYDMFISRILSVLRSYEKK